MKTTHKITTTPDLFAALETALARATKLGYAGEYAQIKARDWVGKTDDEIEAASLDFNQNYQHRQKYARAAAMETNPERKAHLESQAWGWSADADELAAFDAARAAIARATPPAN